MQYPSFAMEGDFEPGMSGGPILNDLDQVCGVVSRSGGGMAYGSILWPALSIKLENEYLLDFAKAGKIRAKNYHCVQLHHDPNANFPGVSFDPRHEFP